MHMKHSYKTVMTINLTYYFAMTACVAQCEVLAYVPVVVDAALRRIGKSRHGGHKIANISHSCQWIWKRISPMDSAYFSGRSEG